MSDSFPRTSQEYCDRFDFALLRPQYSHPDSGLPGCLIFAPASGSIYHLSSDLFVSHLDQALFPVAPEMLSHVLGSRGWSASRLACRLGCSPHRLLAFVLGNDAIPVLLFSRIRYLARSDLVCKEFALCADA